MSDMDEREFDIDSEFEDDEDVDSDEDVERQSGNQNYGKHQFEEDEDDGSDDEDDSRPQANKRDHHNALERKRRDHIKGSYSELRESIPTIRGTKASRAQTLQHTADHISEMRGKVEREAQENKRLDAALAKMAQDIKDADEELRKRGLEVPDDADAGLPLDSSSDEFEEGQGFDSRKRRKIGRPNIDVY